MITFCGTFVATPLRLEHRLTYEVLRNGGEALNVPMDVCCLLSVVPDVKRLELIMVVTLW